MPVGALAYDSVGKKVYVGTSSFTTPLYSVSYSSSTGYGAPTAVTVSSVNGQTATSLSGNAGYYGHGGVNSMIVGPDNNIWIAEHNTGGNTPYVAVAVINSPVVNPATGGTIQPGAGVFAEYALAGPSVYYPGSGPNLKAITSMGGYIWVVDKDGDLWRINPTNGLVNPNLSAGYLPGQAATPANRITDPTGATTITSPPGSSSNGYLLYSALTPIGSSLYFGDEPNGSFDGLSVDTSTTPSTGICSPPGTSPCIATFQRYLNGAMSNPEYGGTSDGTSYYTLSGSNVVKITPPNTLTTSAATFSTYNGGLGITSDGWLWTLTSTGVAALQSMTSTASPVTPTAVTSCDSVASLERSSFPIITGPDGTLLFSPVLLQSSGTSFPMFCAVVY